MRLPAGRAMGQKPRSRLFGLRASLASEIRKTTLVGRIKRGGEWDQASNAFLSLTAIICERVHHDFRRGREPIRADDGGKIFENTSVLGLPKGGRILLQEQLQKRGNQRSPRER